MIGMALLTAFLFLVGFSLPLILGIMILVNSFSALFTPASQAMIPSLVPKPSLEDANGLLSSTASVTSSIGSATGGILVVLVGSVWGLGINALTYALSAIFLIQIASDLGRSAQSASRARTTFRRDFSEGMGYVLHDRTLVEVSFGYLPSNFLSAFVAPFFVVYAATRFGGNAAVYGYLVAALAAGVAVGSLIVGRVRARPHAGVLMGICLLIEGCSWTTLALSTNLGISLLAPIAAGLAIGFANTLYYSTIQAVVPGHVLGRVLSIGDFGSFAAIPTGLVVGGLLIARYGVGPAFLTAGIGVLITATTLLLLPDFRRFGRERGSPSVSAPIDPPPARRGTRAPEDLTANSAGRDEGGATPCLVRLSHMYSRGQLKSTAVPCARLPPARRFVVDPRRVRKSGTAPVSAPPQGKRARSSAVAGGP